MAEPRIAEVRVKLLVTEQAVKVLGEETDDKEIADKAREYFLYEHARVCELREVTLRVPLPDVVDTVDADAAVQVQIPQDIVEGIRRELRERELGSLRSLLLQVLPAGRYEVYSEGHSRGIRRLT